MILIKKINPITDIGKFSLVIIPINWLICLIVSLTLFFIDQSWALGYLLGSITSYLTFGLHAKNVRMVLETKRKPYKMVLTSYIIRLVISAAIIAAAYFSDGKINIYTTVIGLLVIKVMLIIYVLIKRGNVVKEEVKIINEAGDSLDN